MTYDLLTGVPRETAELLERYVSLVLEENGRQNLISKQSVDSVWDRHVVDSAQLVRFAQRPDSSWLDIGSGAGLPGIVIAILTCGPVTLVEPRRLRASFLQRCIDELGLKTRVQVRASKVQQVNGSFDVITARAVAPIDQLLSWTRLRAHEGTRWVLPKGRSGIKELAQARANWQGRFRAEPSITEGEAVIVVAEGVEPRGKR